jgi:hypothetical protein
MIPDAPTLPFRLYLTADEPYSLVLTNSVVFMSWDGRTGTYDDGKDKEDFLRDFAIKQYVTVGEVGNDIAFAASYGTSAALYLRDVLEFYNQPQHDQAYGCFLDRLKTIPRYPLSQHHLPKLETFRQRVNPTHNPT